VLGAGQLQIRKGVLGFIALAKAMPHTQFIWAGGFSFGKITDGYKEIKPFIKNPPENLKFLGLVDRTEMADIYNMSDLLFLPSYDELFPMTILEAISCKTPVLLRDIDVYPDILFDCYCLIL
jgi:1,2-diacylglycerol-3-alpha-glucose alpha-1,2-galactosyltransferase